MTASDTGALETAAEKPKRRIAILGTAPSSLKYAPFNDPSWEIWACSPGVIPHLKRCDEFFELHRWGQEWLTDDYRKYLGSCKHPVWMINPLPEVPTSRAYPKAEMLREFGPHWFTSTPAWMLALAIVQKPAEIGIYGIDMATNSEYAEQRPGCTRFMEIARERGIDVTLTAHTDLHCPPPLYGFSEVDPKFIKFTSRLEELKARRAYHEEQIAQHTKLSLMLAGGIDDMEYVTRTWGA